MLLRSNIDMQTIQSDTICLLLHEGGFFCVHLSGSRTEWPPFTSLRSWEWFTDYLFIHGFFPATRRLLVSITYSLGNHGRMLPSFTPFTQTPSLHSREQLVATKVQNLHPSCHPGNEKVNFDDSPKAQATKTRLEQERNEISMHARNQIFPWAV